MRRLLVPMAALALMAGGALPGSAMAATGKALGVDPQATAQTGVDTHVLTVGADIFIGDKVVTGEYGLVQIKFDDSTELVVGPHSTLVIEDYLLRDDGSAGKLAINALAGTFRFATGLAQKDKYLIKTPTGTIGVRGTAFDFNVTEKGTEVLLFHGAVKLCNVEGACVTLDGTCELGQYDSADSVILGPASDFKGEARDALKAAFKYAQSQQPLLKDFWVDQARDCLNKVPEGGTAPQSLVAGDGNGIGYKPEEDEGDDDDCYYECYECAE